MYCPVAIVVVTGMATRNPAKTFIDSSDPSESEPTLASGDSDDLTSESESEEDNPAGSKVTEPPRDLFQVVLSQQPLAGKELCF